MTARILAATCVAALAIASTASAGLFTSVVASADGDIAWSGLSYSVDTTAPILTMVRSGGNNVRNGVMEFDLASLPSGAILTSAAIRVTTSGLISNTTPTAPLRVFAFPGDGLITSDDHQNNTAGILVGSLDLPTGSGTPSGTNLNIDLDWTTLQAILDDGAPFIAIRFQTENFATIRVHSLETSSSTATLPTLDIAYIPSPAAGILLLGLLGLRRRRA